VVRFYTVKYRLSGFQHTQLRTVKTSSCQLEIKPEFSEPGGIPSDASGFHPAHPLRSGPAGPLKYPHVDRLYSNARTMAR
jgi:hypothetical protein